VSVFASDNYTGLLVFPQTRAVGDFLSRRLFECLHQLALPTFTFLTPDALPAIVRVERAYSI